MYSITDDAAFNSTSAYYAVTGGGGGGGGGNVVVGTGQNFNANPIQATFWEVGELLFCAVMILTGGGPAGSGISVGNGVFTLPAGKAWIQGQQASYPQIIATAYSPTLSYNNVSGPLIANAKFNIQSLTSNQSIGVQCVDGSGAAQSAFVNVLAFGPKAP